MRLNNAVVQALALEFEFMGAEMMRRNVDGSATILDRRFRSWFGTSSIICAWGWHELESRGLPEGVEKKHYLWALTLMKTYETEANLSSKVGAVDETTFRKWAWLVVDLISWLELDLVSLFVIQQSAAISLSNKLLPFSQIVWDNRHQGDVGNDCLVSVDGVDCQIPQVLKWDPIKEKMVLNKQLYSHKFKGPGLRFEVGICLLTSDIVWLHG